MQKFPIDDGQSCVRSRNGERKVVKRKITRGMALGIGTVLVVPHWHTFLHHRARNSSFFFVLLQFLLAHRLMFFVSHSTMLLPLALVYVIRHYASIDVFTLQTSFIFIFFSAVVFVPTRLGFNQNFLSTACCFLWTQLFSVPLFFFNHAEGSLQNANCGCLFAFFLCIKLRHKKWDVCFRVCRLTRSFAQLLIPNFIAHRVR